MGTASEIELRFSREKHARWAKHVAEEMIRLIYAGMDREAPPWVREAARYPALSRQYLAFRQEAASYPLDPEYTALAWLRRYRTRLFIDRCQDIARWESFGDPEALFPQLCCALILRFPQVSFTAHYRCEMTVTGAVLLYRVWYDGSVMHVQKKEGMRPLEEDDWSREPVNDYTVGDGIPVKRS